MRNCEYKRSMDYSQPQNFPLSIANNQTILAGDLLVISDGKGAKASAPASAIFGIADGPITTGARATQTLTFTGVPVDNQTVTIGDDVYELTVDGTITEGNIKVQISNTTADIAVTALALAINNNPHSKFWAVANTTDDTVVITAKYCGAEYNGVATTETCTNAAWGGTETAGGTDTTVNGIVRKDDDSIPVLALNDKSIIRMGFSGRLLTDMDLFTTRFDIVVSGSSIKVNTDDTNGGSLIPVAYSNTEGWVDVIVDATALWNA